MTDPAVDRRAQAMRSLADAVDEAAAMPTADHHGLPRIGDVVGALAEASLEMRLAYWGYPQPGSVGDQPLVIVVDGREHRVANVAFAEHRLRVDIEPPDAGPVRGDGED